MGPSSRPCKNDPGSSGAVCQRCDLVLHERFVTSKTKRSTPQVFVDGKFIGGDDQIQSLEKRGASSRFCRADSYASIHDISRYRCTTSQGRSIALGASSVRMFTGVLCPQTWPADLSRTRFLDRHRRPGHDRWPGLRRRRSMCANPGGA